jgi:hypothetical protein
MDPLAGTPYEGWTQEELEARLEELEDEIQQQQDELAAAEFEREIEYLQAEGFIDIEDGRIYPQDDTCVTHLPIES